MKRAVCLAALSALLVSVAVCSSQLAQTAEIPLRLYDNLEVVLFENETGATVTRIAIIFDQPVTVLEAYAIGGGYATLIANTGPYAWIQCRIDPGGTFVVQLDAPPEFQVTAVYYFF